jgi:hypothetical protein
LALHAVHALVYLLHEAMEVHALFALYLRIAIEAVHEKALSTPHAAP